MGRTERSVLLDSNLLVLLVVGATSRNLITKHKRTRTFVAGDYDLLLAHIGDASILVLPNIATETSNLVRHHGEPDRRRLLDTLKRLLGAVSESYVASTVACGQPQYSCLGLTDAAILAAGFDVEVLTMDIDLHRCALGRGLRAVNFNHLRDGVTV